MCSDSVGKTEQTPYKEASLQSMLESTERATPADSKPGVAGGRAQGAQPAGSWERCEETPMGRFYQLRIEA